MISSNQKLYSVLKDELVYIACLDKIYLFVLTTRNIISSEAHSHFLLEKVNRKYGSCFDRIMFWNQNGSYLERCTVSQKVYRTEVNEQPDKISIRRHRWHDKEREVQEILVTTSVEVNPFSWKDIFSWFKSVFIT